MVTFSHIGYVWFFGLVLVLLGLMFMARRQRKIAVRKFAQESLTPRLLQGSRPKRRRLREWLGIIGVLFLVLALIGPQVGRKLTEVKRVGVDIIIALDTSISMDAEDITPSRLERSKYEVSKFIDRLYGDRVGLVAFAGISYLHCPLTLDYSAAKLFLDAVDTGIIGTQGTAIAEAIQTALQAFQGEEKKHKVLVMISDGEDHEGDIATAARQASEEGVIIFSVGCGSLSGAPIPLRDEKTGTDFKRDRAGHVVTTALEEKTLQEIANLTGGSYYNMGLEASVFEKIYEEIMRLEKKELRSHEYSDFESRYQIFLLIGLLFILAEILLPEKNVRLKRDEVYAD